MKLEKFIRIFTKDYKQEFQQMVEQLAGTVNRNFEVAYEVLAGKVNLRDNIACTVKEIDVSVDANGIPTTATSFKVDSVSTRVDGVVVLNVLNLINSTTYPPGAVFVSATQANSASINLVTVNKITGLTPFVQYRLRLVAFFVA